MVRRILVVAVLALLGVPGVARAAVTVSAGPAAGLNVVFAEDDGAASTIETARGEDPSDGPFLAVKSSTGASTTDPDCQDLGDTVACLGTYTGLVVSGNGGNDTVTVDQIEDGFDPLYAELYGDAGDDTITGTPDSRDVPQPETFIDGGTGNDKLVSGHGEDELHGGDGNDTVQSFEGADVVRGEGGNDSLSAGMEEPAANAADVVDGGPGVDRMPNAGDYNRGIDDDVSITMDGVANDGEPGEGDNVIALEGIYIEARNANYSGTSGPDDVFVDAANSTIRGLGGDDKLVDYDGHGTLEGGDGNDYLEGGFGNDVLDGGAGVDRFNADRNESNVIAVGRDTVRARDGNAEAIECGIGPDTAIVDAGDVVSNCESVDRGPQVLVVDGLIPPPGKPKVLGKLSVKRIASKGLAIRVRCPAACTVVAELRVTKALARKLKLGRSRVLARGKKTLRAAGDAKVTLKVVRKAKKRFKRLRKAKVTLVTRTTVAGRTTHASRALKLKR